MKTNFDDAVAALREDAYEVGMDDTWTDSHHALDSMTDVLIAFLLHDDGGYLNNFGAPSMHHTMNAYHYYGFGDDVIVRVINGCESYMSEGWDDYFDLIETAKVLAAFTWARDHM